MKRPHPESRTRGLALQSSEHNATMMRIPCICCGPRDENEFVCGGTSHIQRPALDADDEAWAAISSSGTIRKACTSSAGAMCRAAALVQSGAQHGDARSAVRLRHDRAALVTSSRLPAPFGVRLDRGRSVSFEFTTDA